MTCGFALMHTCVMPVTATGRTFWLIAQPASTRAEAPAMNSEWIRTMFFLSANEGGKAGVANGLADQRLGGGSEGQAGVVARRGADESGLEIVAVRHVHG